MPPSERTSAIGAMAVTTGERWRRIVSYIGNEIGDTRLSKRVLILAAVVAATWPVWRWMFHRFADGSGDTWELLAGLTAAALLFRDRDKRPSVVSLEVPAALLLAYAVSYSFLSPLPRSMFAMAAIGSAISMLWYGRRIDLPICGLLLISLPVMASLNFYLGYPLRVVAGTVTEALLQMNGFAAFREGAQLTWEGQSVAIDAPCSGVKMLWTGAYLTLSLSALMRLTAARTLALVLLSLLVVIAANSIRAAALFYVEAGIVYGPEYLHESIGVVMFAFAAVTMFVLARNLAGVEHAY